MVYKHPWEGSEAHFGTLLLERGKGGADVDIAGAACTLVPLICFSVDFLA